MSLVTNVDFHFKFVETQALNVQYKAQDFEIYSPSLNHKLLRNYYQYPFNLNLCCYFRKRILCG